MDIFLNSTNHLDVVVKNLFTSATFWSAIIASIFIIFLGFLISKISYIKNNFNSVKQSLNTIVVLVAMPSLILSVYMSDLSSQDLIDLSIVLAFGTVYAIFFNALSFVVARFWPKLIPNKWLIKQYNYYFNEHNCNLYDESQILGEIKNIHRDYVLVQWSVIFNNSVTFFGLPMVQAIFGNEGSKIVLIFQIVPVICAYSLGVVIFGRINFNKNNLKESFKKTFNNPLMISLIIGLFMWLTQLIPGASIFTGNWWETTGNGDKHGWFNFQITFPPIYKIVSFLGGLVSPLIWIITGLNISKIKLNSYDRKKNVLYVSISKYILLPLLSLCVLILLTYAKSFEHEGNYYLGGINSIENYVPSRVAVPSIILILIVTPTTPLFTSYAVEYKNNEEFVSSVVGTTSLLSSIFMPIWFIISYLIFYAI